MSYIKSCQLSGYKSIKNVSCEFKEGLNIIIGNNGSGKSNLLEFIQMVFDRDYVGLDIFHADIDYELNKEQYSWKSAGLLNNEKAYSDIEIVEPPKEQSFQIELIRFNLPLELPIISDEFNPRYNHIEKRFIEFPRPSSWSLTFFIMFNWAYKVNYLDKLEKIDNESIFKSLSDFVSKEYKSLKDELAEFTPIKDFRISNAIRVSKIDSSVFEFRNIVFEYHIGNEWLPWQALSDGTRRLIYIFFMSGQLTVQLKVKGGNTEEINYKPVILFDEPELGIHPHQLHLLLNFLKQEAESQQIIITTHSPQVLDVLGVDELDRIKVAEIDFQQGTIIRELSEEEIIKAKQYLKDEGLLSDYWRFSDFQRSKISK